MNPTRIVASGGMLPLALPGSHDGTADTAIPAYRRILCRLLRLPPR